MTIASHVPKIIGIVACSYPGSVIGVDGELPWDIKRDKQFFRDLTSGHVVIMGRKTYETLGNPLKNRENVVVSREDQIIDGIYVTHSLSESFIVSNEYAKKYLSDIYIIGGAQIYKFFFPFIEIFYVTYVRKQINDLLTSDPLDELLFDVSQTTVAIPHITQELNDKSQWRSLRLLSGTDKQYNYTMVRYNRIPR